MEIDRVHTRKLSYFDLVLVLVEPFIVTHFHNSEKRFPQDLDHQY